MATDRLRRFRRERCPAGSMHRAEPEGDHERQDAIDAELPTKLSRSGPRRPPRRVLPRRAVNRTLLPAEVLLPAVEPSDCGRPGVVSGTGSGWLTPGWLTPGWLTPGWLTRKSPRLDSEESPGDYWVMGPQMLRSRRVGREIDPGPVQIQARKVGFDVKGHRCTGIPGHPVASHVIGVPEPRAPGGRTVVRGHLQRSLADGRRFATGR